MLPATIVTENDRELYRDFIVTFGTHYLDRAIFGARLDFNSMCNEKIVMNETDNWISTQYGFDFHYKLFVVSTGGFQNQSDIQISKKFLENCNSEVSFYGGNPSLANLTNIDAWTKTLVQYMYPMNTTLIGLWELASDATKQATTKKFIRDYIAGNNTVSGKNSIENSAANYLGSGFDITTLTGGLAPLFEFTYNNNNYYNNNQSYPDQVFAVNTPDSDFVNVTITMTDTFDGSSWEEFFYQSDYGFLGLGTKTEVYRYYQNFYENQKSLSETWVYVSYLTLTLPLVNLPKLDPLFKKSIDLLPRTYDSKNSSCQQIYFDWFVTFGTCFPDQIVLGGTFNIELWYDTTYIYTRSLEWIQDNAEWSLGDIM